MGFIRMSELIGPAGTTKHFVHAIQGTKRLVDEACQNQRGRTVGDIGGEVERPSAKAWGNHWKKKGGVCIKSTK